MRKKKQAQWPTHLGYSFESPSALGHIKALLGFLFILLLDIEKKYFTWLVPLLG